MNQQAPELSAPGARAVANFAHWLNPNFHTHRLLWEVPGPQGTSVALMRGYLITLEAGRTPTGAIVQLFHDGGWEIFFQAPRDPRTVGALV